MTSVVVGAIDDAFADEEFLPLEAITYADTSVRRSRTEEHPQGIDWHDADQVREPCDRSNGSSRGTHELAGETAGLARLRGDLANDGYQLTDEPPILRIGPQLPGGSLTNLKDPAAIEKQLERLAGAVDNDPALAVGSAKELVESTAEVVLTERGLSFADRAELPELVRAAQEALMLQTNQQAKGSDGTQAVKTILGGLIRIVFGLAERRNHTATAPPGPGSDSTLGTLTSPSTPPSRGAVSCSTPGTTFKPSGRPPTANPSEPGPQARSLSTRGGKDPFAGFEKCSPSVVLGDSCGLGSPDARSRPVPPGRRRLRPQNLGQRWNPRRGEQAGCLSARLAPRPPACTVVSGL